MYLRYCILISVLFLVSKSVAQVDPLQINLIPPSPNAAALGKYGDTPVSFYTGTPSIEIPIMVLPGKELSAKVSLSYNASGIRVEEVASSVGLGWTLNAGGAIIRTLRGQPDEHPTKGILNNGVTPDMVLNATPTQQASYLVSNNTGNLDFEPDIFVYNFNGKSGKFFLQKSGSSFVGYSIPFSEMKIVLANDTWTITDSDGVKYIFGTDAFETTLSTTLNSAGRSGSRYSNFKSAWFLKKIISVTGEEINFTYLPYEISLCQRTSETSYVWESSTSTATCNVPSTNYSYNETVTTGVRLESITSVLGKIVFTPESTPRLDLPGDYAIKEISVYDYSNVLIKKYVLGYDYFISSGGASFSLCNDPSRYKRLKLNSVQEVGSNGELIPPYIFGYNAVLLPDKFSNSQDHWGYFNGAANATTLVPPYTRETNGILFRYPGANRASDVTKMKAGVLEQITYPMGGKTVFDFEANETVYDPDFFPYEIPYVIPTIAYAGLIASNGSNQTIGFDVNLPETEAGKFGGLFTFSTRYGAPCNPSTRSCGGIAYLNKVSPAGGGWSSDGGTVPVTVNNQTIFLTNGHYELTLEVSDPNQSGGIVSTGVNGPDPEFVPPINRPVGGLRVKSIKDYDETGLQTKAKNFTYLMEADPNKSSGIVVSKPVYYYTFGTLNRDLPFPDLAVIWDCYFTARQASTMAPLSTTQGNAVGYKYVQVYEEDKVNGLTTTNGKEVYKYTTAEDYPDNHYYNYPFAMHTSKDWLRGLLLEQSTYARENSSYNLVKKVTNNYSVVDPNYKMEIYGLSMGCQVSGLTGCAAIVFTKYKTLSNWYKLDNTIEQVHSTEADFVQQRNYYYDHLGVHTFLSRSEINNSKGEIQKNVAKYPLDYQAGVSSDIDNLVANRVIEKPIEQQEWVNGAMVKGQIFSYQVINGKVYLKGNYLIETTQPLNFTENKTNGLFTDFLSTSAYKEQTKITTNPTTGNVTEIQNKPNQLVTSFVWGYGEKLLVAQAENATFNQIYYQGFEDTGTVGIAKTGRKFYNSGQYTIPFSPPADGKSYLMSYWYWSGGVWNFRTNIPFNASINQGTQLDDIRVFPSDSKMTTYTHDALVGVTSVTDFNNRIIFFTYDPFGRLKYTQDDKGNLVESYNYKYKN